MYKKYPLCCLACCSSLLLPPKIEKKKDHLKSDLADVLKLDKLRSLGREGCTEGVSCVGLDACREDGC